MLDFKVPDVVASSEPVNGGDLLLKDPSLLPVSPAVCALERGTQKVPSFYFGTRSFPRKLLLFDQCTP